MRLLPSALQHFGVCPGDCAQPAAAGGTWGCGGSAVPARLSAGKGGRGLSLCQTPSLAGKVLIIMSL